jgi:hypothetical protein
MPALSLLVVCLVAMLTHPASMQAQEPRVRALDPSAAGALERGQQRSQRFRALLLELNRSDVIVHVVTSAGLADGIVGTTRFVGQLGGSRYLRVDLAASLQYDVQVVMLAHELQHACEVARSSAASSAGIRALYQDIGKKIRGRIDVFETRRAIETAEQVRVQLRGGAARLQAANK